MNTQEKEKLLLEYKESLKRKIELRSSELVPNGTVEHAAVLISTLFSYAKDKIEIFTGKLNPLVYTNGQIMDSAEEVLKNKKVKMEILIQEKDDSLQENSFLNFCQKNKNCKIKEASAEDRRRINHFVVVDSKAFRFEPDKNRPLAVGCFYRPDFAKQLNDFFAEMFQRGTSLKV